MCGYTSSLKPHPEVIPDEVIEGIIDLASLKDHEISHQEGTDRR